MAVEGRVLDGMQRWGARARNVLGHRRGNEAYWRVWCGVECVGERCSCCS